MMVSEDFRHAGYLEYDTSLEDEIRHNLDIYYGEKNWSIRRGPGGERILWVPKGLKSPSGTYFITGNEGKFETARMRLGDVIHNLYPVDSLEISEESYDVEEIAKKKAVIGRAVTCRATLADDSGFIIPAAEGLPGSRVKRYLEDEEKGLEWFLDVARAEGGSTPAYFLEVLAYAASPTVDPETFVVRVDGTLLGDPRGTREGKKWLKSDLSLVFVQEGCEKTLAEMTMEEYRSRATTDRWEMLKKYIEELSYFKHVPDSEYEE